MHPLAVQCQWDMERDARSGHSEGHLACSCSLVRKRRVLLEYGYLSVARQWSPNREASLQLLILNIIFTSSVKYVGRQGDPCPTHRRPASARYALLPRSLVALVQADAIRRGHEHAQELECDSEISSRCNCVSGRHDGQW